MKWIQKVFSFLRYSSYRSSGANQKRPFQRHPHPPRHRVNLLLNHWNQFATTRRATSQNYLSLHHSRVLKPGGPRINYWRALVNPMNADETLGRTGGSKANLRAGLISWPMSKKGILPLSTLRRMQGTVLRAECFLTDCMPNHSLQRTLTPSGCGPLNSNR